MAAKKSTKKTKAPAKTPGKKTTGSKTVSNRKPREEMKMTTTKAEKIAADATILSKDQMDAFMKSGNLWMKGTEEIVKTYVSMAQGAIEKNSEAVKTLMGCRTLNELTETQAKLAQQSFDDMVTTATKLSELSVKVATESFEPLNTQFSQTMKKATRAAETAAA